MHVGKRELLLALRLVGLRVLVAEESLTAAPLTPLQILLGRHQHGSVQVGVAYLRTDEVEPQRVVVLHLLPYVLGRMQIKCRRVQVFSNQGCRALNLPAGMQQRVRDGLVLDLQLGLGFNTHPHSLPNGRGVLFTLSLPVGASAVVVLRRSGEQRYGNKQEQHQIKHAPHRSKLLQSLVCPISFHS